mgnify:CR=1 FL=1
MEFKDCKVTIVNNWSEPITTLGEDVIIEQVTTRYCVHCGNEALLEDKFCSKCGKEFEIDEQKNKPDTKKLLFD